MSDMPHETEVQGLRRQLEEAEETLRAIRSGEVDALVVAGAEGDRVYTLQGADQAYRTLIEAMHQGAVSLTATGTILYCNRCFANMVKTPQEKVIGALIAEFLPYSQRPAFDLMLWKVRAHNSQGELLIQAGDGSLLPVYAALAPLPLSDAEALCMVVTDLTEQKKHEDLQEADRRKDEFLATLAHELRNPLAPIRNAVQVLGKIGHTNPTIQNACDMIERQVSHMVRLVDDLLDVSRITRGRIELRRERLDAAAVVKHAVETSRPLIEAEGHELTVSLPLRPLFVEGDLTRLAQVLANLLNNAAKYTPAGGLIELSVMRQGSQAVFRVRDNGLGIPVEMMPRIFDMFTQVDKHLERSQGGLGIGLTLVRSLLAMHGGTVEATSAGAGQGTEFIVRLPLLPDAPIVPAESPPTESCVVEAAATSQRRRILVVDDSKDSAESLALLLRIMEHEVRTAYDGPSALETVRTFVPDVVFCDIGLPGMSGFEVARAFREMPALKNAYLVAQTGWGQEEDRRHSKEAGFDHHLVKPLDPTELQQLLAR